MNLCHLAKEIGLLLYISCDSYIPANLASDSFLYEETFVMFAYAFYPLTIFCRLKVSLDLF